VGRFQALSRRRPPAGVVVPSRFRGVPIELLTVARKLADNQTVAAVTNPEVAFVLPAGGSIGAVQVGILRALAERGIQPDVMVGCSVGALNAAFYALNPGLEQAHRLAAVWQSLDRADVFGTGWARTLGRIVRRRDHIYDPDPLRSLIGSLCPLQDLGDARIPVHVVTTDIDFGLARWWSRGPAPVQRAVDLDATTVYLLGEVFGPSENDPPRNAALDVLLRSFAVSRYARLPDPTSLARAGQRVVVVPGAPAIGIDITDFSHTRRLITESVIRAHRFLDALDAVPAEARQFSSVA
jgi:hypothetical protein